MRVKNQEKSFQELKNKLVLEIVIIENVDTERGTLESVCVCSWDCDLKEVLSRSVVAEIILIVLQDFVVITEKMLLEFRRRSNIII